MTNTGDPLDSPNPAPDEQRSSAASGLVDNFFRHNYARLVATLTRQVGASNVELVEDSVQTALMTALSSWTSAGIPNDRDAWLSRVARNEVIGALRKDHRRRRLLESAAAEPSVAAHDPSPGGIDEELLRMLFVCCDEEIPRDSRLVLALKTLCGFSTAEIALRLFTSEGNVIKRLGRARKRMRELAPDFYMLPLVSLESRLASVHLVLYLLFNEGYLSAQSDRTIRRELCDEAIRLCTLLAEHPVGATPETFALLALMHLHAARLNARLDGIGGLVLLEEQDRSLWDRDQIRLGAEWLQKSARGDAFTRFHAEAGIAAEYVLAPSFAETRWGEISELYEMLERVAPSPLNAMNRAVVVAAWRGPAAGLAILEAAERPPWLFEHYLWDAVLGELHRRTGHLEEAARCIGRALAAAPTDAERGLLRRRLASINSSNASW